MAKDTFYFSHDYNARNDIKIRKLISKHGLIGYGIYWALIEDLYNNTNVLHLDYDCISYDLRVEKTIVESVINDFELFQIENNFFGSLSVQRRLDERNEKSVKARESIKKRWEKNKNDTNVLQPNYDSNTIKERKGKEIKENNIVDRKLKFADTLKPFLPKYGKEFIRDFYSYWTEPNVSNTKFKKELQKTWSLERRLETWSKNEKTFAPKKTEPKKSLGL